MIEDPPAASARRERLYLLVLLLAMGAYIGARIIHLVCGCMDGDEIFSVSIVRNTWHNLWRAAAGDSVHPPLFYFFLKAWIGIFGESLLAARVVPALFSILALAPWYLLCRELGLRRIETAASIAIGAIHPFLLYYSQHVRMYSMLMAASLVSLWLFVKLLKRSDNSLPLVAALTAANALMVYSHYYGWLVLAAECGYALVVKRRLFLWLALSSAAVLIAFVPWLVAAGNAAAAKGGLQGNLWWIGRPGVLQMLWWLVDLTGCAEANPMWMRGALAFGYCILLLLARSIWAGWFERSTLFFLFVVATAPALAAALASNLLPQSIWGHRHLIFSVPPFAILAAVSILRFEPRAARIAAIVFLLLWGGFAVRRHIRAHDRKLPWDALVLQVLARETGPVGFYGIDPHLHYPVRFYLEALKNRNYGLIAAPLPAEPELGRISALAPKIAVRKVTEVPAIAEPRAWVAYIESRWLQTRTPAEILASRGCRVGDFLFFGDRYFNVKVFPVECGPSKSQGD